MDAQAESRRDELEKAFDGDLTSLRRAGITEAQISQAQQELASDLHQEWQDQWMREHPMGDSDCEPRWKKVGNDPQWTESLATTPARKQFTRTNSEGVLEVDIAHVAYSDLPADWQRENREAAATAVSLVSEAAIGVQGQKGDPAKEVMSALSSKVHDAWRQRNSWIMDDPSNPQRLDFEDSRFPLTEANKDRQQVSQAAKTLVKVLSRSPQSSKR